MTSLAKSSQRVSFVHNNFTIKFVTKLSSTRQIHDSSISRVNRVNNQKSFSTILVTVLDHKLSQFIIVLMRKFEGLCSSKFRSVSQTDVALLIHKDDSTSGTQIRNQIHTSQKSGGRKSTVLSSEKFAHTFIRFFHNSIFTNHEVTSVVSGSSLFHFLDSIVSNFFVHVETPVAQRRHQDTVVVISLNTNTVSIRFLVKGNTGTVSPILLTNFRVITSNHSFGNILRTFDGSLVLDNLKVLGDSLFDKTGNEIQMGHVIEVFTFHVQFLGHLVECVLLLQSGVIHIQQGEDRENKSGENAQNQVGGHVARIISNKRNHFFKKVCFFFKRET
mmetsp:Transcript_9635/g.12955  ORF Transcript_9635/g.12955 Transcript_9635/m.12955 type:complete len:331 (-) Transcript_9635:103-1095(-)